MKLRAYTIVADAVEQAAQCSFPYAVRRWFKYREGAAPELLEDREFIEHVKESIEAHVLEALGRVIDYETGDDLAVKAPEIHVYHGGGGWRWVLTDGEPPHRALSPYFPTREQAVEDAQSLARATGLAVHIEPEDLPSTP